MRVLFSTSFDVVTRYFLSFFYDIPAEIKLLSDKATQQNLMQVLRDERTKIVILTSHGEPDKIFDNFQKVALDVSTVHLLKNKVCIVIACHTAHILGRYAFDAGTKAYFGFNKEFIFPVLDLKDPRQDIYAQAVLLPYRNFVLRVVRGERLSKAFEKLNQEIDEQISKWEKSKDPFADVVVKCLVWNKTNGMLLFREEIEEKEDKRYVLIPLIFAAFIPFLKKSI